VPVSDLVSKFGVEIPGVIDGSVLTQSIGTALARGQFARVPVINGTTHDEELLFVDGLGLTVSQGTKISLVDSPVSSANYQANIARALGVTDARDAAIAGEYPFGAYPSPDVAFSLPGPSCCRSCRRRQRPCRRWRPRPRTAASSRPAARTRR
jgi:para-nitrobenzyl esterase